MPAPSALPAELLRGPFLLEDALRLGVGLDVLDGDRFRTPFSGVRVAAAIPDSMALRCRAVLLLHPAAAISHASAAALQGLPLPAAPPGVPLEVRVPSGRRAPRLRGVHGHTGLRPDDVVPFDGGVRVVRTAVTWGDLADRLSVDDLVVLGDAVLRRGLAGPEALASIASGTRHRRGLRSLRLALPLLEARTDSPMETRLRLLLIRGGLPRPEANRDVVVHGGWIARPDLSYPQLRIAIEFDGDHHRSRRQWLSDRARRQLLEDAGWLVLELTADDVLRRPEATVERVRRAILARAG